MGTLKVDVHNRITQGYSVSFQPVSKTLRAGEQGILIVVQNAERGSEVDQHTERNSTISKYPNLWFQKERVREPTEAGCHQRAGSCSFG
jgi:hypothetical protein